MDFFFPDPFSCDLGQSKKNRLTVLIADLCILFNTDTNGGKKFPEKIYLLGSCSFFLWLEEES